MARFAHLGDTHIGAWRDQKLKDMNMQAFIKALDKCVEEEVDFIIIAGDLFDSTFPDLALVHKTAEKIKEVKDKGINLYLTYGSHDFAANSFSIIDILNVTDLFTKVVNAEEIDGKIHLRFTTDSKTGAKITGLSGRKLGLEKKYFEMLETDNLEKEKGFKIFVFHNAIVEVRSGNVTFSEGVPLSCYPRGFDYYAGGHVHENLKQTIKDYGVITFSGCLFGADFTDIETTAKGEKRGFYIVDFEDKITDVRFVEVKISEVYFKEIDATKKTTNQVTEILKKTVENADVKGKIALLKVSGELLTGKPSDINFNEIRQILYNREALVANISHYSLSTAEKISSGQIKGENRQEIEQTILSDIVKTFKIDPSTNKDLKDKLEKVLLSESGILFATNLLNSLKVEKQDGETNKDFEDRILKNTLHLLNMEDQQ